MRGLGGPDHVLWRAARHGCRPETHSRGVQHDPFGPGIGDFADLYRRRIGRDRDGLAGRADWNPRGGDGMRLDDRGRAFDLVVRWAVAAICLQPVAGRAARCGGDVRAPDDLCHTMV